MASLRTDAPRAVAGRAVEGSVDYATGAAMPVVGGSGDAVQMLPAADMVEFSLEGGCTLIVRPSGTEPKIKAYLFAKAETADAAARALDELDAAARALLA